MYYETAAKLKSHITKLFQHLLLMSTEHILHDYQCMESYIQYSKLYIEHYLLLFVLNYLTCIQAKTGSDVVSKFRSFELGGVSKNFRVVPLYIMRHDKTCELFWQGKKGPGQLYLEFLPATANVAQFVIKYLN